MKNRLAMCRRTGGPCSYNCQQGRTCVPAAHTLRTGSLWGVAIPAAITLLLTLVLLVVWCADWVVLLRN